MRVAIIGNFGLTYKATMAARALPLARALAERGHQLAMFLPEDPRPFDVPSLDGSVRLTSLGPALAGRRANRLNQVIGHLRMGLRLTRAALWSQPDVLYAFKPKAYAGLALMLVWMLRKITRSPIVLALDTDDWEGAGGWADREHASSATRWLVSWHERWCLSHADIVTVASRGLAALASDLRGSTVYLPNAAAPSSPGWHRGDPQRLRNHLGLGDKPVILAYTRFAEFSPERLLATFRGIVTEVPNSQLVVAGQGLRGEERAFERSAEAAGLAASIHLLGWVPIDQLPDVFSAVDVALYPLDDTLLNRTKCVMKLVDLLLAGVPVVADCVGQADEYVDDGETGLLVPAGDVSAMSRAAIALLRDPVRGRALGNAARSTMLGRWSWQHQSEIVEHVFIKGTSQK